MSLNLPKDLYGVTTLLQDRQKRHRVSNSREGRSKKKERIEW